MLKKVLSSAVLTGAIILSAPLSSQSKIAVFEKPSVSLNSLSLNSISTKNVGFNLYLNIDNPNIWGITIKKVEYKLDINGNENVAQGITEKELEIKKQSKENQIEVPVQVNNNKVFPTVASIIKSPGKIEYKASGKVYFNAIVGDIPIPFSKSGVIDNSDSINKVKEHIKSLNPLNYFK